MVTISVKGKIDDLGIELEKLTNDMLRDLAAAVQTLAGQTFEKAVELTASRLHSTRQQYIDALHLSEEGPGIYVVYLDPAVNYLEDGQDAHPMLPQLAQGPKSKVAKDGSRYVIIPLRQHTAPINPDNPKQKDLADRLKSMITKRKFEKVKSGISGKTGKYTTVERMKWKEGDHPYLKGAVRIREYKNEEAAQKRRQPISSAYMTFRVASTKQDPAEHWFFPGTAGAQIFPELEKWADQQLETIIKELAI